MKLSPIVNKILCKEAYHKVDIKSKDIVNKILKDCEISIEKYKSDVIIYRGLPTVTRFSK